MNKFLLALILCITSVGFHAPEQASSQISGGGLTLEEKKANRKKIWAMGFSCEGQWVANENVWSVINGVKVIINPSFSFVISDEGIKKLLEQADSAAPKTFTGSDLSVATPEYPNILKHMEIKVEARGVLGSLYSGNTKYFEIKLNLPIACDGFSVEYERLAPDKDNYYTRTLAREVQSARSEQIRIGQNFNLYNAVIVPLFVWTSELVNIVLDPNFNSHTLKSQLKYLHSKNANTELKITLTKPDESKIQVSIPEGTIDCDKEFKQFLFHRERNLLNIKKLK